MSGTLWLPKSKVILGDHDGGSMLGGPPRFVHHTYEANPERLSATKGAQGLRAVGNEVHLVFNPISGEVVQMLPANRAARGLRNRTGGVQTNRCGSVCIQIEVIAYANRPWTSYITAAGKATWARIMAWVRSLGIPDRWPAGPPPRYDSVRRCNVPENARSTRVWTREAGHYGHSQVPENDHGDPGALDSRVIFAKIEAPVTPVKPPVLPTTKEASRVLGYLRFAVDPATYDPNNPTLNPKLYELWPTGAGGYGAVWVNASRDAYVGVATIVFDTEAHLLEAYPLINHVIDTLPVR